MRRALSPSLPLPALPAQHHLSAGMDLAITCVNVCLCLIAFILPCSSCALDKLPYVLLLRGGNVQPPQQGLLV